MKSHFLFHQIFLQYPLKPHPAFSRQKNPDIFSDPTPNMTLASTGCKGWRKIAKCNYFNLKWQSRKFTAWICSRWRRRRWVIKESRPKISVKVSLFQRQASITGSVGQRRLELTMFKACQGQLQGRKFQGPGATEEKFWIKPRRRWRDWWRRDLSWQPLR